MESVSSPSSPAVLALWNDIAADRIAEYERWHTLEHVPERVWVPGFLAGTRYVSAAPDQPRYFTLYEMQSLASLTCAEYDDLVAHPTPWSASMRPSFSNFLRKPGTVMAEEGVSAGTGLVLLRIRLACVPDSGAMTALARALMTACALFTVTRLRVIHVTEAGPQAMANVAATVDGEEIVVLAETAVESALADVLRMSTEHLGHHLPGAAVLQTSCYRYASRVLHRDVAQAARPKPRRDLMPAMPPG